MLTDVASYEKEVQQNTLGNNLVAILLRHGFEGHVFGSPSAVKAYLRGRIADTEAELHRGISVALADSSLGASRAVRDWLRAIPYLVSGSVWWSQQVGIQRGRKTSSAQFPLPDWTIQHPGESRAA
jgi:hypothetical protein